MDVIAPGFQIEGANDTIDLSDHVLVVGSGLIGLDAVLILAQAGVKTSFVSSTPRLSAGVNVFINEKLDSTFLDSQGLGGMSKFWAGQLMRMEKRHFLARPGLSFPQFIEYDKYYQASKLVEHDYGLSDFDHLSHSKFKAKFSRKLPGYENVFSQFIETNMYSKLMMQIRQLTLTDLPPLRVMYFENTSKGKVEVTCKNLVGEKIVIICKQLLLAAGTVGNTEIVLRSREHCPYRFDDSAPIGNYLVDHPIIDLGSFEVKGSRLVNFKINQEIKKGKPLIKAKFVPKPIFGKTQMYPDAIIEIAPRITNSYLGKSTILRKIETALSLLFIKFGVDLRIGKRLIDVTLHLEQVPNKDNCIQLDEKSDNVHIQIQLSVTDRKAIDKYSLEVENRLTTLGYVRYTKPSSNRLVAYHFSGSLRMGAEPSRSVVNLNCEVHGNSDVTVLGLSNFPTTGFTNPTFSALVLNRILLLEFQARQAK